MTNSGIGLHTGTEGLRHILAGCRPRVRRVALDAGYGTNGSVLASLIQLCSGTREDIDSVIFAFIFLRFIQPPTEVRVSPYPGP